MNLKSIRWRLPLSYAAIALLTAGALGAVLLTTLRGYYAQRERDYLTGNAQAIAYAMAPLIEAGLPPEVLQTQLDSLAFLSQTRVRVLDASGQTIAESSTPETFNVALAAAPLPGKHVVSTSYGALISIRGDSSPLTVTQSMAPIEPSSGVGPAGEPNVIVFRSMPVVGTPYGFGLDVENVADGRRSDQVVRVPVRNDAGDLLGYVELGEGPAYGRDIVNSVARGWALAGAIAVLLAAGAGWLVSRGISAPLLALTHVTTRMAGGDLTARATDIERMDEFGLLARSFNCMAEQVERTVVTLRRFVSDAAHEIRTPLTALRTNLELAKQDEHVARAQTQVERLDALTAGLLDLARIEAGAFTGPRAPVDLVALTQEVSELYASRAEQAGLTFEVLLPEQLVVVQGDAAQLQRALGNLLDNAIKFTPEGGAVQTGIRWEGERVAWWVEDTGIGIPAEDLPHLFGRFHRGRNAAPYPGSGLGLAIVKAIVEAHGGEVQAANVERGARFTIRLPSPQHTT